MPADHAVDLAIVIPVFHDNRALSNLLGALQAALQSRQGARLRVASVVVDGAADAATADLCAGRALYVRAAPGRGQQIAAGISALPADWVWVLHADTRVQDAPLVWMDATLSNAPPSWGRFDVQLPGLPWLAWFMNWRSRLTKICTGDQGMFFATSLVASVGGFPQQPLMEDIELSKRLKRSNGVFLAPRIPLQASTRRWREKGVMRTVLSMWRTRVRYFFGVSAAQLYADYYGNR